MTEDLQPVEALERLSRQEGVDVRPILVRVLTDLFVQKPRHSPDEIARYEEVTLKLLDAVPIAARIAVARKLADDPEAPRSVIEKLLADDCAVASPILARFAGAPRQTLMAAAVDGGPVAACAVASRADLDGDMIRILAHHPEELVAETLTANPAVILSEATLASLVARAQDRPALAAALLRREDFDAAALVPLYLQAEPGRRAAIRAALISRPTRSIFATRSLRDPDTVDAALVEAAANAGRGHLVAEALGTALGLKPDDAAWLSAEPSGEPFVMMLRAAGVDGPAVARALLVSQPEIARSTALFFHLVEIAEETPRAVAADIVAALVGETARATVSRHEPLFDPSGVPERAGAARAGSRARPRHASSADQTRQRG